MTRLWPEGQPIEMSGQRQAEPGQEPSRFTWQGREHRVVEITRAWRVDVDWWRGRVWRAYYKVTTDTGLLAIIYQDLLDGAWRLQRIFD